MTVTAQRRQPPVVPLTLTSDLTLQGSPQQLSPTALASPINITQVRLICAEGGGGSLNPTPQAPTQL